MFDDTLYVLYLRFFVIIFLYNLHFLKFKFIHQTTRLKKTSTSSLMIKACGVFKSETPN